MKAFVFTAGIAVPILAIHYVAKRYHPTSSAWRTFREKLVVPRHSKRSFRARPNRRRRTLGEKPRMRDFWTASLYPLCPQPESSSEWLGLGVVTLASALVRSFRGQLRPPCWRNRVVAVRLNHARRECTGTRNGIGMPVAEREGRKGLVSGDIRARAWNNLRTKFMTIMYVPL